MSGLLKFTSNTKNLRHILIASTSTFYGSGYLGYLLKDLKILFKDTEDILFVPYARPGGISYEDYTSTAAKAFSKIGKTVNGIQEFNDPIEAVKTAKGIFVGGGNTFVLVNQLYGNHLIEVIRDAVNQGTPYLGTSAGSNICGLTIGTTNDMPIIYPPSFKTFGFVPFNINPHYLDPDNQSKHMGETRVTRIKEFHKFNTQPVIGLREGSWLEVKEESIVLKGSLTARIFEFEKDTYEVEPGTELQNLK